MSSVAAALTIGRLARAAGVGIPTVRYYERRGLLPKPARRASGYRMRGSGCRTKSRPLSASRRSQTDPAG